MRIRCFFKLCTFGPWERFEAAFYQTKPEDVSVRQCERRTCRWCGRREERGVKRKPKAKEPNASRS